MMDAREVIEAILNVRRYESELSRITGQRESKIIDDDLEAKKKLAAEKLDFYIDQRAYQAIIDTCKVATAAATK